MRDGWHPYWVDDTDFDIDYHVRGSALPDPGDMDELTTLVARIHERPLDQTRPLWEVYVISGLADGRVAVYTKTHHVVVDGVSGIQLLTALTDTDPDPRPMRSTRAACR